MEMMMHLLELLILELDVSSSHAPIPIPYRMIYWPWPLNGLFELCDLLLISTPLNE